MIAPPRAERRIRPAELNSQLYKDWIAQVKMNGQYLVVTIHANGEVTAVDRHGEKPKAWQWSTATKNIWRSLLPPGEYCAELLHGKVPGIRDTFYLHDVLAIHGTNLLGMTYQERHALLGSALGVVLGNFAETPSHYIMAPNFWLAKNHTGDFLKLFDSLSRPEEEGLVLKNPKAKLTIDNRAGWTVKCRRPTKNFPH